MLSNDEINTRLSDLNSKTASPWKLIENTIGKEFVFKDFSQAWTFMNNVATAAEKADHHPDWYSSYNKVKINLTTHQAGGLTEKDFSLAEKIEQLNIL
jgi:4a-hydroxytetrahydrobiopterin dehydratase